MPTALDDYEFDLRGYLVLRNVLSPGTLRRLNVAFDRFPALETGEWMGNAQRRDYNAQTGFELHNCLDCGDPAFDELIDHPGWINHVLHYAGEEATYVQGVTIDECIASIRRSGGHHPVHSGGHHSAVRTQYRYENGRFRCGQVNILMALTDIGEGDGATMVIPGSHKSNFPHPLAGDYAAGDRMDVLPGAEAVYLKAGDAVMFVDSIMHGGSSRTTPEGERRVIILRYGPSWGKSRFGYHYSNELLDRLPGSARHVLEPVRPLITGDLRIGFEAPRREVG